MSYPSYSPIHMWNISWPYLYIGSLQMQSNKALAVLEAIMPYSELNIKKLCRNEYHLNTPCNCE